jgi:hypothetical protein
MKAIKTICGWVVLVWGALGMCFEIVEKLEKTHHYAVYLYSHWSTLLAFFPRPFWMVLSFLVIGTGLIFSDRISDFVESRWPRHPKLQCTQIMQSAIAWDQQNGCYRRKVGQDRAGYGIWLEIANEVEHGRRTLSAGRVKAKIVFRFKGNQKVSAAPAAWMDEPLSSVEFAPGDTRCLIAATSSSFTQDWNVPLNRRSDINRPQSFEHYEIPGLLGNDGMVDVQLISLETNKVLVRFTFPWRWKPQYPLEILGLVETKR